MKRSRFLEALLGVMILAVFAVLVCLGLNFLRYTVIFKIPIWLTFVILLFAAFIVVFWDIRIMEREKEHTTDIKRQRDEYKRIAKEALAIREPIRCKDCKYWQDKNGGYPHPECRWGHGETPDEDDYCSYAERE